MAKNNEKNILIIAGEASGDLHGAHLVKAVKSLAPYISLAGIGGTRMKNEGVEILVPSSDMAVVGVTEVFSKVGTIIKARQILKSFLRNRHPDLLVLIDYPDFNINIARIANRYGVPVLYYIGPQVWAWRKGRVKKIARRVDRMAVILPFEKEFYRNTGISLEVEYVGHPLLDAVPVEPDRSLIKGELGIKEGNPVVGLLPGSRNEEINNLLPLMIKAAEMLSSRYGNLRFVLPPAPTVSPELLSSLLDLTAQDIIISDKDIYSTLSICDLAIVASGTATLETAIMEVPMVMAYRVSRVSFRVARMIVKVPHVSLVNLIAGEEVVPELIQDEVTPDMLADKALEIFENERYRKKMIRGLKKVKEKLGKGGASGRAARIALKMMGIECN